MAKLKIKDLVSDIAADYLGKNGYELYNVEFVKEGRDWFLRVFIDLIQDGSTDENCKYISTEDCEKVSRFLSEKLDESDPIEQNYYLEVSSPGMDRPLIRPEHYQRYIGHAVDVKLYKSLDGQKNFSGILTGFEPCDNTYCVTIKDMDGREWQLDLADIAKTRLAVIF